MTSKIKFKNNICEGYIQVIAGKVWYKIAGAQKSGAPLLILHGGPAATHYYLEPLQALANKRPVIFYDQLGCGLSDKTNDKSLWSLEYFVEELSQIRKVLNLDNVHILGHSWGSMLAVDYMLKTNPEGVASLIFSGPCLNTNMWSLDQRKYLLELPLKLQEIILQAEKTGDFDSEEYQDAMMDYYKVHICRLNPWPECLNKALSEMNYELYKYMWGPSEFTITGTLKGYDRLNELCKIKAPVLLTCGEFDEATPETTAYYHKKLPQSKISVFKGASHNHHLEDTKDYIKVVSDFLRYADNQ